MIYDCSTEEHLEAALRLYREERARLDRVRLAAAAYITEARHWCPERDALEAALALPDPDAEMSPIMAMCDGLAPTPEEERDDAREVRDQALARVAMLESQLAEERGRTWEAWEREAGLQEGWSSVKVQVVRTIRSMASLFEHPLLPWRRRLQMADELRHAANTMAEPIPAPSGGECWVGDDDDGDPS